MLALKLVQPSLEPRPLLDKRALEAPPHLLLFRVETARRCRNMLHLEGCRRMLRLSTISV